MYSLRDRVKQILSLAPADRPQPTGITRQTYLDLIERILTIAAPWQDERGAIIDPVAKIEHAQTSCRFVAPGAVLLSAGRGAALRENVLRGMDWCCRRLASGKGESPDFWMRELMTAYNALADVDPARRRQWADDIRAVVPEKTYWCIAPEGGKKLFELHNWTIYAAGGEMLRQRAGLGPKDDDGTVIWGRRFWDKYIPPQLRHFNEFGMYRDPGDPMTYDFTTRLQLMVGMGTDTPADGTDDARLHALLRQGMLTQLLYVSPEGYAPFGGRSGQFNMQEAILAATCESEACYWRDRDPVLAGAFKRQARLHARSIIRWILDMTPMRHIKNGFPPDAEHGCERYAKYSVYSLFAASCLALAYQFADETIEEGVTPSDVGGYALELKGAFHKVFATVKRTQIEIDTAADPLYDATGLGRFHRAGVPLELALAVPLPSHPKFHLPADLLPPHDLAIGPGWCVGDQWTDLSTLNEHLVVQTNIGRESADEVIVRINWTHEPTQVVVHQRYHLTEGMLKIEAEVTAPQPLQAMRFTVPLLQTDGAVETRIEEGDDRTTVEHATGARYVVRYSPQYTRKSLPPCANRNGIYRPLILQSATPRMTLTLTLEGPRV